jgi:RNA polymerase sigma-70 factor (ECF subfamily)
VYDDDPREPLDVIDDERLRLIFTCCHPALAMETRVALTLRMVAGLTVPEIARAFLNPRQLRTWAPRRPIATVCERAPWSPWLRRPLPGRRTGSGCWLGGCRPGGVRVVWTR